MGACGTTGLALAAALAGACSAAAAAQDLPATVPQPGDKPAPRPDETIVVTGTRLPGGGEDRPSPTQLVRPEAFVLTGVPNVEQTLNQLPQLVAGFTNTSNNPGTGAATLDLRGLGSVRTLILVNGRRWIASDAGEVPEVDVNTIPAALIDRVEIVTGGASAVYGSDAVTGVINFILKDDLDGVHLDARQNLTARGDGRVSAADLSAGTRFLGGRGSIVASVGWVDQASVLQGDRLFSSVSLADGCAVPNSRGPDGASLPVPAPVPNCPDPSVLAFIAGGSTSIPGTRIGGAAFFPIPGADGLLAHGPGLRFDPDGTARPFVPATDLYNFAPPNYLQVPFRRWSANLFASLKTDAGIEPYTELGLVRTVSKQQLAPVAGILARARINLANPFLPEATARILDTSYGVDAAGRRGFTGSFATGFRPNPDYAGDADGIIVVPNILQSRLDLGPRRRREERDAYRILGGVRGELGGPWSFDVYYSRSRVDHRSDALNSGSAARLRQALLAVTSPSGEIVCIDPSNGCVPANIFGAGNLSAGAADFIGTDPRERTRVGEQVAEASVRGALPLLAAGPAGLAAGVSWRRTAYSYAPDPTLLTGDDLGFRPGVAAEGSTSVREAFAETRVPLLAGRPLAHDLSVELGLRWSDYRVAGSAWTWKALGEWSPWPALRIRGGYQRAVRAPNVRELFEAPVAEVAGVLDPCSVEYALVSDPAIAAACVRNGVPPDMVGGLLENAAIVTGGGNRDVEPEVARTIALGAVLRFDRPDLVLSLDYYDIDIKGPIGVFGGGATSIVFGCIVQGADPADPLCQGYGRGSDGAIERVEAPTANLESLVARGIDWQLGYTVRFAPISPLLPDRVTARLSGTHYLRNALQARPGLPALDCAGRFGGACGNTIGGTATPRWKLYNEMGLAFGPSLLMLRHRWFSPTRDSRNAQRASVGLPPTAIPAEGLRLESRHYLDAAVSFDLGERFRLTLGVNNLAGARPAIAGTQQVQANTDPSLYDVLGRRFFAALSAKLH